jgi:hypothetical protein
MSHDPVSSASLPNDPIPLPPDRPSIGDPPSHPDRPPAGPSRPSIGQTVLRSNPYFLFSAVFMLFGSLLVTNSLSWSPQRLSKILTLAATINVYELLLVFLAVLLWRRPKARRDASILLIIEAFFLVDVTFLNAELFAIDRWVGLAANLVVFALAIGKLAFIFRGIGIRPSPGVMAMLGVQLVALFALPGVLKFYATSRGGTLPALAMLGVWWTLFAIGVACVQLFVSRNRANAARGEVAPWFAPLLIITSGVSLLAHAGTSQWIYDLHFWGADLAPMLALAAFAACLIASLRPAGVILAAAAVFAAASHNNTLVIPHLGSPVHLTAAVIYGVLAWTLFRAYFAPLLAAGASVALLVTFGPSIETMRGWAAWVVGKLDDLFDALWPKTQTQWGVYSIVVSFLLLGIGAFTSLRKRPSEDDAQPA